MPGRMSRRVLLGTLASTIWSRTPLVGQDRGIQIVAVEGEGTRFWTRWRGPSGQGLATGSYPDTWSATQNVQWRVPVPGRGNSSPIVWRDRVILTTAYDGGRRLSVLVFRRSDGARLW